MSGRGLLLALIIGLQASAAFADDTQPGHWEVIHYDMSDLLAQGFELKAVVEDTTTERGLLITRYYLQKDSVLDKCNEVASRETTLMSCHTYTK